MFGDSLTSSLSVPLTLNLRHGGDPPGRERRLQMRDESHGYIVRSAPENGVRNRKEGRCTHV